MLKRYQIVSAVAAAILAANAGVAVSKDKEPAPPKPPSLSKPLVKPLTAAQTATKTEKWAECLASAREADAVPNKTAYDTYVVNEMIGLCAIRSGDNTTAAQAFERLLDSEFVDAERKSSYLRILMQLNYQAKNYAKAIEYGTRAVSQGNANEETRLLTAQSYYLQPDYKGAISFLETWLAESEKAGTAPSENAVGLYLSSCIKLEDDACMMRALTKQAAYHPKDETWSNLVMLLLRNASNDGILEVYRLASEVGGMRRGEDYIEMAQLATDKGLPGEAQAALEAAIAKKNFNDPKSLETATRMLATAKTQVATDKAGLSAAVKSAAAGKNGQVDVRMGQALLSYGMHQEALEAIQRGISKGNVRNMAEAQLALGHTYLRLGNKDEAIKAFNAVQGDELLTRLGSLWAVFAKR
jgi:tetratricopeptide (TPR) repeat protein